MEWLILGTGMGMLIGWFMWADNFDLVFVVGVGCTAFAIGMLI